MKNILSTLIACALLALALPVKAQVTPTTYGAFTNAVVTATNTQTVTLISNSIPVFKGEGLGLFTSCVAIGATTDKAVFEFNYFYYDGRYTTTTLKLTNTLAGTTTVTNYTPLSATSLEGVERFGWKYLVNTADTNITGHVIWSRRN